MKGCDKTADNIWNVKKYGPLDLVITEINRRISYVAVVDKNSGKEYFTQGEEAENDIYYIDKYGEDAFLDMLASSGYFSG